MPYPIQFSCACDIYYLMNILSERDYSLIATAEREIVRDIRDSLCFEMISLKSIANRSPEHRMIQPVGVLWRPIDMAMCCLLDCKLECGLLDCQFGIQLLCKFARENPANRFSFDSLETIMSTITRIHGSETILPY